MDGKQVSGNLLKVTLARRQFIISSSESEVSHDWNTIGDFIYESVHSLL